MKALAAPPVFLDRDGTVIVEKEYLSDPAGVVLEGKVLEGLAMLQAWGHPLIVVSNQSGVGRGKFAADDAHRVNARVAELLVAGGVTILAWYICPHAPEVPCDCRKPLPGMAFAAARDWQLELRGCYVIGDKRSDVELATQIAGTGILVTTGHGRGATAWAQSLKYPVFPDLAAAANFIGQREASLAASAASEVQPKGHEVGQS